MYEAPTIKELGTVAEMTEENVTGGFLDADFVTTTPIEEVTLSG